MGFSDSDRPDMRYRTVAVLKYPDYTVEHQAFDSWPGVKGAANLYLPKSELPVPWILLCCGHGGNGKLNPGYQAMARHLAANGIAVLVPDNIGQGERVPMGHRYAAAPFHVGLSLQSLILQEFCAHIKAACSNPRFNREKLGAIGNSGGGTATCFLAAFADELSVMVSSGYPSTFEFVARKEKVHCCCNVLPGLVGKLEMWQLYGCFSPRPLLLFQGRGDSLFSADLFKSTARRVAAVYHEMRYPTNFESTLTAGEHSWDAERITLTGDFLCRHFGLRKPADQPAMNSNLISRVNIAEWRDEFLDVPRLCKLLTGQTPVSNSIYELFPHPDGVTDQNAVAFYIQTKLFTGQQSS